jgi:hypothetical protein
MKNTVFLLSFLVLLFSCSSKEVKPVSPESKTALEAFSLAETVRTAFIKNDLLTLQNNSLPEGYTDITVNRRPFDSVDLTFTPRWVEIEKDKVILNVAWKSLWTASGKTFADRGMAVFVLEGSPLKIAKIPRGNPFIFPEK